ncbi:MAG TPA: hypothetical protein VE912_15950, partial [Bacteroidales bacterium]|nr:hypothetical protein [Bacteroidales bacterium]
TLLHKEESRKREDILRIIELIRRGRFLQNSGFEWMDSFKAQLSNEVIDTMIDFSSKLNLKHDADLIIKIADGIILFDTINENAMEMKCRVLVSLGKHSLARDTYTQFMREYKELYGEPYGRDFNSIIE